MESICPGHEQGNGENRNMRRAEEDYLRQLDRLLGAHPDKAAIMKEYKLHISEMACDIIYEDESPDLIYKELSMRLGTPEEVAVSWKQELTLTPRKTRWIFAGINLSLFISGILLTFINHTYDWNWAKEIWSLLTSIPVLLMAIYIGFWVLLGYEIGKEFGHQGKKLIKKTLLITVIPNIILMYLVIFNLVPDQWFDPLLDKSFIIACVFCTFILYPVSFAGYLWGKKASL